MGCIKFSDIVTEIDFQRNAIMEEHVANLTTAQINTFMFHRKSNYDVYENCSWAWSFNKLNTFSD